MGPHARLHAELLGLLRQHSQFCDQRHLVLLAWMVAGLLLSQTVCFDRWKAVLPLGHCLPASWQRRMSFVRLGLAWLQQIVANAGQVFMAWMPIPLRELVPCIPSLGVQRRQKQPWFTRIELQQRQQCTEPFGVASSIG